MVRLVPMDDDGFRLFLERAIPRRAERWTNRGIWTRERAIEASRQAYAETFPQGRATPHQFFLHVVDGRSGRTVGEVWFESREGGGKVDFHIQWLGIEPEFRGQGFGTETLRLLEQEARHRGADATRLEVWLDNPDALRLYSRLGYETQVICMAKPVGRRDPGTA
jgi:ribosomal protein S18 acetylase RimI-like enzyme